MYVPKSEFGWSRAAGWLHGDEAAYNTCVAMNKKHASKPGRARQYPAHPSWNEYLPYFISTDPTRSQGAFCRWAGLSTAYVSAAKNKRIAKAIEEKLSEWIEELQKGEPNEI